MTRRSLRYHDRITHDPAIMVGKPIVRGTRIPVEMVLNQLSYNPDLPGVLRYRMRRSATTPGGYAAPGRWRRLNARVKSSCSITSRPTRPPRSSPSSKPAVVGSCICPLFPGLQPDRAGLRRDQSLPAPSGGAHPRSLDATLGPAPDLVTPAEARSFIYHCGYRSLASSP